MIDGILQGCRIPPVILGRYEDEAVRLCNLLALGF